MHLHTREHLWASYLAILIYEFFCTNGNKCIILTTEDKAHNSQTFSLCLKKYFIVKTAYALFKSASLSMQHLKSKKQFWYVLWFFSNSNTKTILHFGTFSWEITQHYFADEFWPPHSKMERPEIRLFISIWFLVLLFFKICCEITLLKRNGKTYKLWCKAPWPDHGSRSILERLEMER